MKSFPSYKLNKKTKYLIFAGLVAAYLLGFSSQVYSPAHAGRYAIPIPTLIPVIRFLTNDTIDPKTTGPNTGPAGSFTQPSLVFKHTNIITTYFWVGEKASGDNGNIANLASAWDGQWQAHYGGEDAPSPRSGYNPAAFIPLENPFYFALPYNDLTDSGRRKASAANCPLAGQKSNFSWCKNSWIAIRHDNKVAYAQWEDVGPFDEDDTAYVFGSAQPRNQQGSKAGLDVSPAVMSFLGLGGVDSTDWVFIDGASVPAGPWKNIITTTPGSAVY